MSVVIQRPLMMNRTIIREKKRQMVLVYARNHEWRRNGVLMQLARAKPELTLASGAVSYIG